MLKKEVMSEPIVDFTKEVGRCSYHALESNQELENFIYNGVSYAEGVETYRLKLQNLFGDFKGAANSVALQSGSDRVLKSILGDLEKIKGQYWDIPTQDVIEGYEKEMATGKYPHHKNTIREMKFLQEMVSVQQDCTAEAISFIKGLLGDKSDVVEDNKKGAPKKEEQPSVFYKTLEKYGDLLSTKEMVEIFGRTPHTLSNWEKEGLIVNVSETSTKYNSNGHKARGKDKRYRKADILKKIELQAKFNENN